VLDRLREEFVQGDTVTSDLTNRHARLQNGGTWEEPRMATLNVKNLPDALYRKLQTRAKRQRRSVAQEVTHILSEALEAPKPVSILELQGLGKEHWQNLEATTHVARERAAWD
jgi:plasmid stability protein